jgi:DNA-3-methyladenine glycosylase II
VVDIAELHHFEIQPKLPYSLPLTAERLIRFDSTLECFDSDSQVFSRLIQAGRRTLLLRIEQVGSPARAVLRATLEGRGAAAPDAEQAARDYAARALGTDTPVQPFYRKFRTDPLLGPPIRRLRGLRVAGAATAFESLVTTILAQQVNLSFAYSIREELIRVYGRSRRVANQTYWRFPEPAGMASATEETLRGFRLSGAKARTIAAVAAAFVDGELDEATLAAADDEDVLECLTRIKGVGRWTAEVVLMRGLARTDAFPAADLGVIKFLAMEVLGREEVASEREMREFAEGWRPHRSLALVYAYAEMAERKAQRIAISRKSPGRRRHPPDSGPNP